MSSSLARARDALPAVLFVVAFGVYLWALGPSTDWLDSGELLTGAHALGVSHPPGQPTFTLLGKATMLWPLGPLAFRGALVSALAAALALALLFSLTRALMALASRPGQDDPYAVWTALATCAAFAVCGPLVVEASRAEVYALTLAGALGAMRLWVDFAARGEQRSLVCAAFVLGLTAGANPLLAALATAVLFVCGLVAQPRRTARSAGPALAALCLGGAVFLLLPVRTDAGADLAWGAPDVFARFMDTATGAAYASSFSKAGDPLGVRVWGHALLFDRAVGGELALLALLGVVALVRRARVVALAAVLLGAGAMVSVIAQRVFYAENPDVGGYLLSTFALAFAFAAVPATPVDPRVPPRVQHLVAVLAGAFIVAFTPWGLRRADSAPQSYTRAFLAGTPAGAAVLVRGDHAAFPLLHAQRVEGERPDVAVAIEPLMRSSWYLRALKRWAPEVFVPFVDDGGRADALAERYVSTNSRSRPVVEEGGTAPGHGRGLLTVRAGVPLERDAHVHFLALERGAAAVARKGHSLGTAELVDAWTPLTARVHGVIASVHAAHRVRGGEVATAARVLLGAMGEPDLPGLAGTATLRAPMREHVEARSRSFFAGRTQLAWRLADLLFALGATPLADLYAASWPSPEAQQVTAGHAMARGDRAAAERALHALGEDASARLGVARGLAAWSRLDDALWVLEGGASAQDPRSLGFAGSLLAGARRFPEAQRKLESAVARDAALGPAWTDLGLIHAQLGRLDDAAAAFERAASLPGGERARALLRKLRGPSAVDPRPPGR